MHVNGLVDRQVTDVEWGAQQYSYTIVWLHAKSYAEGGLMIMLKEDIRVDVHNPVPLTPPVRERVMRPNLRQPSGGWVTLMNVHAPNLAADRKVFEKSSCNWEIVGRVSWRGI